MRVKFVRPVFDTGLPKYTAGQEVDATNENEAELVRHVKLGDAVEVEATAKTEAKKKK